MTIQLNKNDPKLSLLFFANDLILFAEASLEQVRIIQSCLEAFCKASGEKVNNDKTNMYVSRKVHSNVVMELSREAGFTLVLDLGKYLGSHLHHRRVNRRSFQFLEEKLSKCLSKWRANFLPLAGCITLAKFMLNTQFTICRQTSAQRILARRSTRFLEISYGVFPMKVKEYTLLVGTNFVDQGMRGEWA